MANLKAYLIRIVISTIEELTQPTNFDQLTDTELEIIRLRDEIVAKVKELSIKIQHDDDEEAEDDCERIEIETTPDIQIKLEADPSSEEIPVEVDLHPDQIRNLPLTGEDELHLPVPGDYSYENLIVFFQHEERKWGSRKRKSVNFTSSIAAPNQSGHCNNSSSNNESMDTESNHEAGDVGYRDHDESLGNSSRDKDGGRLEILPIPKLKIKCERPDSFDNESNHKVTESDDSSRDYTFEYEPEIPRFKVSKSEENISCTPDIKLKRKYNKRSKNSESADNDSSLQLNDEGEQLLDKSRATQMVLANIKKFISHDGVCLICKKFYATKHKAETHIKNSHLMLREFQCTLCPRAYRDRTMLKYHIQKAHPELEMIEPSAAISKRVKIECPEDLTIDTIENYIGSDNTCLVCHATLHSKGSVTRHIKVSHLEIKKFECIKCPEKFKDIRFLRYHDRKFHQ